ncbi:unnamed protein product [Mucor hiemalis]
MSAATELGYHPLEYIPCIVQQIPLPQQQQQIEQDKKDQLIQAATSRLRQKLLEHKYQTLMSEIVEIQSKLDVVKLEASISLQSMDNLHLDHFEKRLENHKLQLQSIMVITSSPHPKREIMLNNRSISSSLSSFSSTISSVLSSFKDKEEESEPEDYFAILGHGNQKRRKRQKMTQQNEDDFYDIDSNASSSDSHSSDIIANITPITSNANSLYDINSCNSSMKNEDFILTSNHEYNLNVKNKVPEIGRKGLLVLHSINGENGLIKQKEDGEERNALDDTLSFLNDLASDSDDGGLRQDIIQLIDTIHYNNCHPELSCRSTPISTPKLNEHPFYRTAPPPFIHSYSHRHRGFLKSTFYNILNTSWKWIRFALVLTLAILINLRRGPSF